MKEKKLAVLRVLEQQERPVDIFTLVNFLGPDYKERTLRRWLSEMVAEGLVHTTGRKKATKYFIERLENKTDLASIKEITDIDQSRLIIKSPIFSEQSLAILKKIETPLYQRAPTSYVYDWFDEYQPNVSYYFSEEQRSFLLQAGRRMKKNDPAGTYAHQIYNRLLVDLSYNSSRLEGNTYSLLETERLLFQGQSVEGKLDEEKIMILNHKDAIRFLVDTAPNLNVNKETICTIHYLLSEELVESKYAGKLRDHTVRIGGSVYMPIEDTKKLSSQYVKIIEKANLIQDPYEQSLFLLIHLSYLQPFQDVNKRTARLSANIPLIKQNLVPLSFNDIERKDYTSAILAVYELCQVKPIVDLFMFSYDRSCKLYQTTAEAIGFDEIRVRYRTIRRAVIRSIVEKKLVGPAIENEMKTNLGSVRAEDQKDFKEDVYDDLKELDEARIAGLGITVKDLNEWRRLQDSTQ